MSGLAPALRDLLDQQAPEALLAELTDEQRAALDGDESLARYLAARLVSTAASAPSPGRMLEALKLIGSIDARIPEPPEAHPDFGRRWQEIFDLLSPLARKIVVASLDAHVDGTDHDQAVHDAIAEELDRTQRLRLCRSSPAERAFVQLHFDDQKRLIDQLSEDDRESLDRIDAMLREAAEGLKRGRR